MKWVKNKLETTGTINVDLFDPNELPDFDDDDELDWGTKSEPTEKIDISELDTRTLSDTPLLTTDD